jgi:hypothetical protein
MERHFILSKKVMEIDPYYKYRDNGVKKGTWIYLNNVGETSEG